MRLFVAKGNGCTASYALSGDTDNLGNTYVVSKLMTTKYPLFPVLIQLAVDLEEKGAMLELKWRRRDFNKEADALTNEDFSSFDVARRLTGDVRPS